MASDFPHRGNLRDLGLPRLLTFIQRHGLSGTLTFRRNDQSKSIYCRDGYIIFAVSRYADDRLGEFLLKKGKITLQQYEESVRAVIDLKKRQGSFLVERGYLSPQDLVSAVRQQVQDIVLSLFTWIEGEFEFLRDLIPSSEVITLRMSTADLIFRGIDRIDDWVRLRKEIPGLDKVLRITTDPMALYQHVELSKGAREFLALMDGKRTLLDLFNHSPLSPFETLKLVHFLLAADIAEVIDVAEHQDEVRKTDGDPPPEAVEEMFAEEKEEDQNAARDRIQAASRKIPSQTYYEMLGISTTASSHDIKRAYFTLSKDYHPDRHFNSGLGEIKEQLNDLFHRITQAYDTLMNDDRRKKYDFEMTAKKVGAGRDTSPSKASVIVAQARAALKKGDAKAAAYFMEEALKRSPESVPYHSLLAEALAQIKSRRREAEHHFKFAIKKDPFKIDNFLGLVFLYRDSGLLQRAIRTCEEALLWDPDNPKILREMQLLKNKVES